MKSAIFLTCLALITALFSCSNAPAKEMPNADPKVILKDFNSWWNYHYKYIKLCENYTPLDTLSDPISKEIFLKSLATGQYVAFRLKTFDRSLKYELYKLNHIVDKDISSAARQSGIEGYKRYQMMGTEIPDFNFTDLNGNVYNKETTKGKLVVLKCWFVHCSTCVAEMPALNEAIRQYKDRNDIVFVSLAFDSEDKLKTFLTKTKFDYSIVSIDEKYIEQKLKVSGYPTHFLINKKGLISMISNDYRDMLSSLKDELAKN